MFNVRLTRAILLFLLLLPIVGLTGCSVFSTVGGWFSQGYENTVAYFNAYYNAKRLFDEAEAEVLAAALAARGKSVTSGGTAPAPAAGAKQKFSTVIDKCSNVLAFSPNSSVVDDALLLIGKSFYYQEDYVKAERKFTELVAQYPEGDLVLDGQLWLLKTLQRLNRFEDASRIAQSLIQSATADDEPDIAAEALSILGDLGAAQEKADQALEQYQRALDLSDDDAKKAEYAIKSADLRFALEQYDRAAEVYLDVEKYSPTVYDLFYSWLQAAKCYVAMEKFSDAMYLLDQAEADYRFFDYRASIRLEKATTLAESGKILEALDAYKLVDSLYYKTDVGAKGALRLAELLRFDFADYAGAKLAYDRAAAGGPQDDVLKARQMSAAFDRYFALWREYSKADSTLWALSVDSLWIVKDSTGAPVLIDAPPDTSKPIVVETKRDSARSATDSLKTQIPRAVSDLAKDTSQKVARPKKYQMLTKPNRASLAEARAAAAYQMGELFNAELDEPDSTYRWLNIAIHHELDSVKAPRALYVMAGVARADSLKRFGDAKELYEFVLEKYPGSKVAEESRVALGFAPVVKATDVARTRFFAAESLIYRGEYARAIDSLSMLVKESSDSTFVPQSLYTMAWIYEHDLKMPDSALLKFKTLAGRYASTRFGAAAQRRIPPPPPPDSLQQSAKDSLKANGTRIGKTTGPDSVRTGGVRAAKDSSFAASPNLTIEKDTAGIGSWLKRAPADSILKNLDLDEIEKTQVRRDSTRSRRVRQELEK
jgi:tetratricopeptide (TPR) repeat protein